MSDVQPGLEGLARRMAAQKMGLVKDVEDANLPDDLWRQCLPKAEAQHDVRTHINWMKGYVEIMTENNWRDMRLYLERQLTQLSDAVDKL